MPHPARRVIFTVLCIPSLALADPPAAPVTLEVTAADTQGRIRFALRNVTGAPVEVVADRRLLSFTATPPPVEPGARRRRRVGRLPRCAHDQRPSRNESSPRVTLEPGQRYSEEADVDDLCGLRSPAFGTQPVEFHYGFAPPRRGSASHARSIVTDEREETYAEVVALAPPSLVTADPALAATPDREAGLALSARGSSASSPAGLRSTVTVRNPSVHALWTLLRPTQFSFVLTTPAGLEVECNALTRQPAPLRDLFVRLPAGGRRSFTLLPAMHCPSGTFQSAGVYRARARFESGADGEAFGWQRVFTGVVESASIPLRVSRGQIVPLRPRFE
ncbi:MAG: hypothetical protein Q8S73_29845 [Deltaproteobacteria bacterium]|nr:hypothetical protein [Myxococcales bacterium]MDP3218345.1 hypothetical protein [Deltaproteobacteria bacterium]